MSMTHEEAARILDPETRLDALAEIEYYGGFHGKEAVLEAVNEACRIAAEVLRNRKTGEALTLEQLLEMDGQPAWCEEQKEWGIIHIDPDGMWANIPFFRGVYCDLDVKHNGLTLYAYQPAHIDREEWTAEWVSNGNRFVCSRCGVRCAKESDETDYYPLLSAFCPSCGRAMTPEAWAELEKRMGVRT